MYADGGNAQRYSLWGGHGTEENSAAAFTCFFVGRECYRVEVMFRTRVVEKVPLPVFTAHQHDTIFSSSGLAHRG